MNETPTPEPSRDGSGEPDEPGFTTPHADRPPTAEEEQVADEVAGDVDIDRVAESYEEAIRTGAEVRGEGQIEPDRS